MFFKKYNEVNSTDRLRKQINISVEIWDYHKTPVKPNNYKRPTSSSNSSVQLPPLAHVSFHAVSYLLSSFITFCTFISALRIIPGSFSFKSSILNSLHLLARTIFFFFVQILHWCKWFSQVNRTVGLLCL